jgi:hypothetical protein
VGTSVWPQRGARSTGAGFGAANESPRREARVKAVVEARILIDMM